MKLSEGLTITLALVAIIIGFISARIYGNRRAKLRFDWKSESLLTTSTNSRPGDLKVLYKNSEVPDPHLLRIVLTNIGARDIPSSSFDAGKSVFVRADGKLFGLLANNHQMASQFPTTGSKIEFSLKPTLIKRGMSWDVMMIVSGDHIPKLDSPIIDTDIVDGTAADARMRTAIKIAEVLTFMVPDFGVHKLVTMASRHFKRHP